MFRGRGRAVHALDRTIHPVDHLHEVEVPEPHDHAQNSDHSGQQGDDDGQRVH